MASADDIRAVLPNISEDSIAQILTRLADIGVESSQDLQHVTEEDLSAVMRPIQARKLLAAWSQPDQSQTGMNAIKIISKS